MTRISNACSLLLPHKLAYYLRTRHLRHGPELIQVDFLGSQILIKSKEDVGHNMALGSFELSDINYFISNMKDNDIVYDIGANVGAYCVSIGNKFPSIKIYAFEPIPLNASMIRTSLCFNRIRNVEVIQSCVSDVSGTVSFSLAEDSAYSSMIDTKRKNEIEKISVRATSLNDFIKKNKTLKPTIIKIDVEGAEMKVLKGGSNLFSCLRSRPRLILMELYDQNLKMFEGSISEIVYMMKDWKYKPYIIVNGMKISFDHSHYNNYYNVFFENDVDI